MLRSDMNTSSMSRRQNLHEAGFMCLPPGNRRQSGRGHSAGPADQRPVSSVLLFTARVTCYKPFSLLNARFSFCKLVLIRPKECLPDILAAQTLPLVLRPLQCAIRSPKWGGGAIRARQPQCPVTRPSPSLLQHHS